MRDKLIAFLIIAVVVVAAFWSVFSKLDPDTGMALIWWILKIVAALWVLYFLVRFIKAAAK